MGACRWPRRAGEGLRLGRKGQLQRQSSGLSALPAATLAERGGKEAEGGCWRRGARRRQGSAVRPCPLPGPTQTLERGGFANSSGGLVTQLSNSVAVLKHNTDESSLGKLHRGHRLPWCSLWLCPRCQTAQRPNSLSPFQRTKAAPALCGCRASHPAQAPGSRALLGASLLLAGVHSLALNPPTRNCPRQEAGKSMETVVQASS